MPDQLLDQPIDWDTVYAIVDEVDGDIESETIDHTVYHDIRAIGLRLVADEGGVVREVSVYADGINATRRYRGALPNGLQLGVLRGEVRGILGPGHELPATLPAHKRDKASGEWRAHHDVPLPPTDVWLFERYRLECEYTEDGRLRLVRMESRARG